MELSELVAAYMLGLKKTADSIGMSGPVALPTNMDTAVSALEGRGAMPGDMDRHYGVPKVVEIPPIFKGFSPEFVPSSRAVQPLADEIKRNQQFMGAPGREPGFSDIGDIIKAAFLSRMTGV